MDVIISWINENPGKAIGAFLGLLFGILFFTLGIMKTLLILIFTAAGYFIGKSKDSGISPIDYFKNIFKR
ncbi:MAG: DUF2273 domain-containing protein [Spirochaetes bacterium]|nr:DUF2273 domain-containing protein [Spirochaetota bacterium]